MFSVALAFIKLVSRQWMGVNLGVNCTGCTSVYTQIKFVINVTITLKMLQSSFSIDANNFNCHFNNFKNCTVFAKFKFLRSFNNLINNT